MARRNPLPKAPPRRRAPGLEPTRVPASTLARVRQMASQVDERDRPFDPKRAPTWRGSRSDLVVNGARMDDFTRGFLETALWAENDNADDSGGEPLDKNYSIGDFDPKSLEELIADCRRFQEENAEDLAAAYEAGIRGSENEDEFSAGHDFWLTRNGHGAGFWDGDYPEPQATRLDEASKAFGTVDLQVDDGVIYADISRPFKRNGMRRNSSPELYDGYAHMWVQVPGRKWQSAPNDDWDMEMVTREEAESGARFVGHKNIDGTRCAVFLMPDGKTYYAQTAFQSNGHRRNPPVDRRDVPHNLRGIEPRRYSSAEMPTENGDSLRYEQTDNCDDDDCEWFSVDSAEGGDYSGGTVARSNYRQLEKLLKEEYPESTPAVWGRLRGSHGSQGIIVKYGDLNDEVRGIIDALSDYPLIDDEDHSELEHDDEEEYWNSSYGGRKDFCKDLGKALGMRWADELQEKLDDSIWDQVFEAAREDANVYWEHSSEGPYIDMKRVIKSTVKILENDKLPVEIEPFEAYEALRKVIANLPPEE